MKLRHRVIARAVTIGLSALYVAIVTACASSSTTNSESTAGIAIETSHVHRDKQLFLVAASKLGRAPPEDMSLLKEMTGVALELRAHESPFFGAPMYYRADAGFAASDRLVAQVRYRYGITERDLYIFEAFVRIDRRFECITRNDVEQVFGSTGRPLPNPPGIPPQRLDDPEPWAREYTLASGTQAVVTFQNQACVIFVGIAALNR